VTTQATLSAIGAGKRPRVAACGRQNADAAPVLAIITNEFAGYRRSSGVDSKKLGPAGELGWRESGAIPRSTTAVRHMQLIVESAKAIENPTPDEIADALSAARFAVLVSGPGSSSYMQFARSRKRGIELEYQVDSLENHFIAFDPSLTMDRVIAAFKKYASGDDSWMTDFQWMPVDVMTIHGHKVLVDREWKRKLTDRPAES
jgi:hypothetical protein